MDYARQQRNPSRHLIGIGGVALFHALLIWGLVSGLARKVVEVVKGPIEVKVIEEVKTPPPPCTRAPLAPGAGAGGRPLDQRRQRRPAFRSEALLSRGGG